MTAIRKKDVNLKDYGINLEQQRELSYFIQSYPFKKRIIIAAKNNLTSSKIMSEAIKVNPIVLESYKKDIENIELALSTVNEALRPFIEKNCVDQIKYEYVGDVPCGRRNFYSKRRDFMAVLYYLRLGFSLNEAMDFITRLSIMKKRCLKKEDSFDK